MVGRNRQNALPLDRIQESRSLLRLASKGTVSKPDKQCLFAPLGLLHLINAFEDKKKQLTFNEFIGEAAKLTSLDFYAVGAISDWKFIQCVQNYRYLERCKAVAALLQENCRVKR